MPADIDWLAPQPPFAEIDYGHSRVVIGGDTKQAQWAALIISHTLRNCPEPGDMEGLARFIRTLKQWRSLDVDR